MARAVPGIRAQGVALDMMAWVSLIEKLTLERRSERWEKKADEHLGRAIQKTEMGSGKALQGEHAERSKEEPGGQRGGRRVSRGRGWRHEGREVTGEHGGRPVQSGPQGKRTRAAGGLCAEECCGLTWVFVLNSILFIWLCWVLVEAWGVELADQGWNSGPLHWERRVLATGPPGKPLTCFKGSLWLLCWDGTTGRKGQKQVDVSGDYHRRERLVAWVRITAGRGREKVAKFWIDPILLWKFLNPVKAERVIQKTPINSSLRFSNFLHFATFA